MHSAIPTRCSLVYRLPRPLQWRPAVPYHLWRGVVRREEAPPWGIGTCLQDDDGTGRSCTGTDTSTTASRCGGCTTGLTTGLTTRCGEEGEEVDKGVAGEGVEVGKEGVGASAVDVDKEGVGGEAGRRGVGRWNSRGVRSFRADKHTGPPSPCAAMDESTEPKAAAARGSSHPPWRRSNSFLAAMTALRSTKPHTRSWPSNKASSIPRSAWIAVSYVVASRCSWLRWARNLRNAPPTCGAS